MVQIDIPNGVVQMAPPVLVAGEVATRIYGLTLNEWFYVVAIITMVIGAVVSAYVQVKKANRPDKEKE